MREALNRQLQLMEAREENEVKQLKIREELSQKRKLEEKKALEEKQKV